MAADRRTSRAGGLLVGAITVALASLGTVAASSASSGHGSRGRVAQPSVRSLNVGPLRAAAATAAPSVSPAAWGGASQVVSGVVQSTSGVQLSAAGSPAYYGTEPATMTLERRAHELIVTVAPR